MSVLTSNSLRQPPFPRSEERPSSHYPAQREADQGWGLSSGWLLAGLCVLGLGAMLLYTYGPDMIRYQKIRSM